MDTTCVQHLWPAPRSQRMSRTKAGEISCNHVSGLVMGGVAPGPRWICAHPDLITRAVSKTRVAYGLSGCRSDMSCHRFDSVRATVSAVGAVELLSRERLRRPRLVLDPAGQQRPCPSQVLVRQSHGGDVSASAPLHFERPLPAKIRAPRRGSQCRSRSVCHSAMAGRVFTPTRCR